ncbi:hypothetical protein B0H15DRAFT_911071 [Mycena belliarum]|uniref:Pentatricopeptide repeat-containing protein-mitochondrial domain-containing protein n=1 Tax=Mycena belliarum TaxID=1033014 RepID=A0AAD6U216_9AGAR|nr:hypothetical protein B0H15DRAFT_911071 [Mycena belliae]
MLRRVLRDEKRILVCARRHASADSALRAPPWSFKAIPSEFQKTQLRTTAARFNLDLAAKADIGQFSACFALATDMKLQGVSPTISTYNTLLRALALAHGGYAAPTLAVLEDMLSIGISPNVTSFNHIIRAHRTESSAFLPTILKRMEELGVAPNATTYTLLLTRFAEDGNLEVALHYLHAMRAQKLHPEVAAVQAVIILAANQGHPKLAVDLAVAFESETIRKVEDSVWLACLHSSAAVLYADGVLKCWHTLVADFAISPDEGLCLLVLHTAARNGLPDLGADVLRVLQQLDIPWAEHHMAPLFEAFCRADNFEGAFSTLHIMRGSGMNPTMETALPVVHAVERNPDVLVNLWAVLTEMKQAEKPIDICVFNTLLLASVSTQPLSRALADYNTLNSYGFSPNPETFHIFIDACIAAGNAAFGDLAFRQLKESGASLDHDIYGKMITLHLTQKIYDEAFLYLVDMQGAGHVPSRHLYEALIVKCATTGDERKTVALDEMRDAGHTIHPEFLEHLTQLAELAKAAEPVVEAPSTSPAFGRGGIDGLAQRFIETGGLVETEDKREN